MGDQYQRYQALVRICALMPLFFGCAVPRMIKYERPYPSAPSVIQHIGRCAITFPAVYNKRQIMIYLLPDLEPVEVSRFGVVLSGECPRKLRAAYWTNNEIGEISPTYQLSPNTQL